MSIRDQIEQRGPSAIAALQHLATEYGDDVLAWAWAKIRARRKRKARAAVSDAADRRRATLAAPGEQGDGQP